VNYPSSCTWTASGPGGSATFTETLTTVAGTSGSVTYIYTDGLGSPVARTDASGTVISRTRYEPYCYVASGVQPTIGFTGHVNDVDTGLTYMQQRYYDPVAGRFLSSDPILTDVNNGASFNRYNYAMDNPYKWIDPDGRGAISAETMLGFGAGITIGYAKGELALTINGGAGIGGGIQLDPRSSENGRMSPTSDLANPALAGITVAGYSKVGADVKTPLGSAGLGMKVGGGKDLVTGQNVGGKSTEAGVNLQGEKLGVGASMQGGVEVSIYIRPCDIASKIGDQIGEKVNQVLQPVKDELRRLEPKLQ
jgi:RHS repeat-associated protein